jgi:acyl-CoA synthetase (NDP forming)
LAPVPEYSISLAVNVVAVGRGLDVPLLAMWESGPGLEEGAWSVLHEAGIPLFRAPADCFRALAAHRDYSRRRARLATADGTIDHGPLAGTDVLAGFDLAGPDAAEKLLDRIGVARPKGQVVTTAAEAVQAAAATGGPVALKLHEPVLTHKTEAGGVRLGLEGADAVAAAFDDIVHAVHSGPGHPKVESVLVQPMVPDGVEILVGVHTDPQLGPMLTVGFGGVLTELFDDVAHRMVPVSRTAAHEMVGELRCAPLLRGFRGLPVRDEDALVDVILRVSWAAHLLRAAGPELELNPIKVLDRGRGAIAVDWVLDATRCEEANR